MLKNGNDLFFYNSSYIASIFFKDNIDALNKYAMMIIKPEALCSSKLDTILELLKKHLFKIIYFKKMHVSNAQVIALWQHSWINVSMERIFLNQKLFEKSESLILILEYIGDNNVIASEYLTYLKGSAHSNMRDSFNFRSILKPINYLVNYIHTSDNVNEFIREIGVLFSSDELVRIFHLLKHKSKNYPLSELINQSNLALKNAELFDSNFYHDKLVDLLVNYIDTISTQLSEEKATVENLLNYAQSNKIITFPLLKCLVQYDLIEWDWNTLIILSTFIPYNEKY